MAPVETAQLLNTLFGVCGDSNVTCTATGTGDFDLAITDGKDTIHVPVSQASACGLANYLKSSQLRTAYLWLAPTLAKLVPQPTNTLVNTGLAPVLTAQKRLERVS
ncbi:MAG: hypothetical protein JRN62_03790 [Nitrososphaerota archaeon]|nr:hypothetical protein [Nitrososphaerota archaeon]MDG6948724.1 hypothetical protein [Nitrososphaerota archaeon]